MKLNIDYQEKFQSRHIAPNEADAAQMLKTIGRSDGAGRYQVEKTA